MNRTTTPKADEHTDGGASPAQSVTDRETARFRFNIGGSAGLEDTESVKLTGGFIRSHGPALVERGYSIVPIKPGSKAPKIAGWQKRHFNSEELGRKFYGYGVGIMTGLPDVDGHAVIGVDLDILDPAVTGLLIEWCAENVGGAPIRIGRAPRAMLVFRMRGPSQKKRSHHYRSPDGVIHGIEVLGTGQQFVAYAVHPSTGKPYTWPHGDLTEIAIKDLPEITKAQVEALIRHFHDIVPMDWKLLVADRKGKAIGLGEDNGHSTSPTPTAPIWKLRLAMVVIKIANDDPRERWIEVGTALYHATGGSEDGCRLWDEWSSAGAKYQPGEPERLWKGFGSVPPGVATLSAATIFRLADTSDPTWRERAAERAAAESAAERSAIAQELFRRFGSIGEVTVTPELDTRLDASYGEDDTDSEPAEDDDVLELVSVAAFDGVEIRAQPWIVPNLIPDRTVTDIAGEGGVGKSLLALQLGMSVSSGNPWLGHEVTRGKVIYLSCEDEQDTIIGRISRAAATAGRRLSDYSDFLILDRTTGAATELAMVTRNTQTGQLALTMTKLFYDLRVVVSERRPKLFIIDTRADAFGGNEIDRVQVRTFIRHLRVLCQDFDLAIVVLSHPSRAGAAAGDGQSGSTAWTGSVRSRLYLTRPDKDDPDRRELNSEKANYGPSTTKLTLRWDNGAFRLDGPLVEGMAPDSATRARMIDGRFMKHLGDADLRGDWVNDAQTGSNYAPKVFAKLDGSAPDRIGQKHYVDAMWRLRREGRIKLTAFDHPSKNKRKFVVVDKLASLKLFGEMHTAQGAGVDEKPPRDP